MEELKLLILSVFHKDSSSEIIKHYHIKWDSDYDNLKEFLDIVVDKAIDLDNISEEAIKELKALKRKKKIDPDLFLGISYEFGNFAFKCEVFSIGDEIPKSALKFYDLVYKNHYIQDGDPFESDYRVAYVRLEKEPKNSLYLDEFLNMMKDGMDFENKLQGWLK